MRSLDLDPVALEIFRNLFISVAEEMGVTLGRTAYSPNIKERRDYSCACFLKDGKMVAQAAHIPVHLGAMPASVRAVLDNVTDWSPGDIVVLNDPYLGGTHLPDITMVSPVFVKGVERPCFFVASRAHHADVGGMAPGSMSLATEIYQEGLIIPPVKVIEAGQTNHALLDVILRNVRTPVERRGDLAAQVAAHRVGSRRLSTIVSRYGLKPTLDFAAALLAYAERLTRAAIARIPDGVYSFTDCMDDDGTGYDQQGMGALASGPKIQVSVTVQGDQMTVDFTGSSPAVAGPLNAVRAIVESATWYVALCLTGTDVPVNSGAFAPVRVVVPKGCFLDAAAPHAVAAGNVETSQRIVDTVLGAMSLALPGVIPAASQGTMNNVTVGGLDPATGDAFAYYETVGGGAGASPQGEGLSGVHVHMTNTLNTPIEALEYAYPLRVQRYALRGGSGGNGQHRGGDGLVRDLEFLCPATVTVLSDRRRMAPYGLWGGDSGLVGQNIMVREGKESTVSGKAQLRVEPGDLLSLRTPGGGGWGAPSEG